jgi:hypothetical protein
MLVVAVSTFLTAIFNYVYAAFINPAFIDVMLQDQMDKLQAKGMGGAQLEQAEKITRFMMSPGMQAVFTLLGGLFIGFLLSLIVAAFLKRPEPAGPPPV